MSRHFSGLVFFCKDDNGRNPQKEGCFLSFQVAMVLVVFFFIQFFSIEIFQVQ